MDFFQPTNGDSEGTYYKLYAETAKIVKSFSEEFIVGGPATQEQGLEWIPRFMDYCACNKVPLDFISHHIYTGLAREFVGEFAYMAHMSPVEARGKYARVWEMAKKAPQGALPLHITEWNTSYSCIDLIHDSAANGAYIAYLLTHVDDMLESYAYWVFCDVFEEADVPRALFHGGFGLLTENGIRKPSFHAFSFANRLKEHIIHLDENSCITKDNQGNMAVLLFHPCVGEVDSKSIDIELKLPTDVKKLFVSQQKVNDQNGNAFEVWKQLGRPRWPNGEKLAMIEKAQYPLLETGVIMSYEGTIQLKTKLPANGIELIEFMTIQDETTSYQGLRE